MSVNKVFDVDLDIKRPSSHRDFTVVNGDNGNRINVTLMDGDSPVAPYGLQDNRRIFPQQTALPRFRTAESRTAASRFRPTMLPRSP